MTKEKSNNILGFLWAKKVWWLTPIIIIFILIALLIFFSGNSANPFIYELF